MLNDYKGEKPDNVIMKEQHEKRPFYKKVSFWVLSALVLFFGGCSVYGLVLGYQYVHAVTEAAHIIADANSSNDVVSLQKDKNLLPIPSGGSNTIDFDCSFGAGSNGYTWYDFNMNVVDTTNLITGVPVWRIYRSADLNYATLYFPWSSNNNYSALEFDDYVANWYTNGRVQGINVIYDGDLSTTPFVLRGKFVYKPQLYFYDQGYGEGYDDGHQDGYQEGYEDGSDTINVDQYFRVVMPAGNDSVQYQSFIDGVTDQQGQIVGGSSSINYREFTRDRSQVLRVNLTLPTNYRAFWLYTPSFTAEYPTSDNVSLQQSWAVDGVVYLPTWVGSVQLWVGVTDASVPDLTYQTISVAFDVAHWGDIKVGAYREGYTQGYVDGQQNPTAYESGYDAGYDQGYNDGKLVGINQGESQAVSGQKALVTMFVTAFQQPFDQIYRFLNFNVLGLNILALFTALLTLSIGIIIIKKVI